MSAKDDEQGQSLFVVPNGRVWTESCTFGTPGHAWQRRPAGYTEAQPAGSGSGIEVAGIRRRSRPLGHRWARPLAHPPLKRGGLRVEQSELDRLGEVGLVLPAPSALGVERPVGRVEAPRVLRRGRV
jgi:hypothetical protein